MSIQSGADTSIRRRWTARRVVETVTSSLSVQLFLLGVVFAVAGYLKQSGPLAAMLAVWGGAFVIIGIASFLLVWKTRY